MLLSWLREVYDDTFNNRQWTVITTTYLFHLVGCTIFADNSATSVSVSYLGFFVDLRHTGGFVWVTVALIHMYKQLGDASYTNTRHVVGYATL